jgi:small GTP-binding protein
MDQSKSLDLNLYEVRIDEEFLKNASLIDTFLYECQCAIFLVDITNQDSFKLIKDLISLIKSENFPYLKKILVQDKLDLESTRQVTSFEMKEYLDSNTSLDSQEIDLKNGQNIKELIRKINSAVNESKNQLPTNIVSEALDKKLGLMNGQGALSFILIGDSTVGKTCFLTRYFKNQFNETFLSTIGIDKEIKHVKVGNDNYKMTLWDTAGQERFKCLPKKYYQNADGVLLLFDVTNEETFNNVSNWMKDVKENSNKDGKGSEIALYLIGNKIDKPDRVIQRETAETQAKSLGMKYFEVSCKINMNIPEVMARMIMECHMKANNIKDPFIITIDNNIGGGEKPKGGCCGGDSKKKKDK